MDELVLRVLYFFVPAYAADIAPILVRGHFPALATPIDGGRTFGGIRILGGHKTWRGLIAGVGDAVKSFAKRRVGIAPGDSWIGFDQLDFMLGSYLAVAPICAPPLLATLLALPVVFVGNVLATAAAYSLHLKEVPI